MKAQKALSIRQPWAWMITQGIKKVENRRWATNFRGRIFIHAPLTVNEGAYRELLARGYKLPPIEMLEVGGLVGEADLVDCVQELDGDQWFEGPFGFVMENVKIIPFVHCRGALGFFEPDVK